MLILEGLVTTENADGSFNLAPMGPQVDRELTQLTLRPFPTSHTCANLRRSPIGVFHVTDDVELLARAALGTLDPAPRLVPVPDRPAARYLADACRWYAFEVLHWDESQPRVRCECRIIQRGWLRDFFGFNRAKHAVVEAAILATRVGILPADEIRSEMRRLAVIVEKTAGESERRAFQLLSDYLEQVWA